MITRRDLLKFFGISSASLVLPKTIYGKQSVPVSDFQFKTFDNWLKSTSKAIHSQKLMSFVICEECGLLKIEGKTDFFAHTVVEKGKDKKKWRDEKGRFSGTQTGKHMDVTFSVPLNIVPEGFAKQLKTTDGRVTFVNWAHKNEFNKGGTIAEFVNVAKEKGSIRKKSRFRFELEDNKWVLIRDQ